MKVGYLGPENSYSHLAARRLAPAADYLPYPTFYHVVSALSRGETDACVLPIENSLQGGVLQNLDLLFSSENLYAVAEYVLKIEHRLIYKAGSELSRIKRVFSHEQAIGQCSRFLNEYLPEAKTVPVSSTAKSVQMIESDEDAGICGAHLCPPGFTLLEGNIADEKNNYTHFLLVRRGKECIPQRTERVFLAAVCPHRPGSLLGLLQIAGDYGLNLTKIESRPIKTSPGEYSFFIEFEGDLRAETVQRALFDMDAYCYRLKLLGAYQIAE